ncbi:hypothetical protein SCHPADRAFT_1003018 [Schizopora paradoxa]|uniref:Uncharacterized protein n=1 Tax=Schizopora paradoxa TaxID=27342 RepID=A0A0H2R1H9_9AGAM|nr:hypothetical protein SCHPADRAFT_1003018 [Schizopora paradoxa]
MPNRHKRILSASSIVGAENGVASLSAMSLRSHARFSEEVVSTKDKDMGEDEFVYDEDDDNDEDFVPDEDYYEETIQYGVMDDQLLPTTGHGSSPSPNAQYAQDDDQEIEAVFPPSKPTRAKLKTKDQLFNLKGINMPALHARTAEPSPYTLADLLDKSKDLPGWKDGVYRWSRGKEPVPEYMPEFLIYRKHPGMRDPLGVALVYEGCPELLLYYYRYFQDLAIPQSVEKKDLAKLGLLELEPHMYVFYRNVRESRDPKRDLLKMWVTDEEEVQRTCESETQDALFYRDKLLGDKATLKGGKKKGTHLEKSGRGHGNGQGDRCLTFMQSIESQRGIAHPPGNMSQAHMKGDETLSDLKEFEKNVFGVATTMIRQYAPHEWIADQVKRFHINNLPAIGVDDNQGFFSQQQINLAGVEKAESLEGLDKNMGKAGLPHYDPKDCPQGYTCMFATSNFDGFGDRIHPGFFHFLEVGLYVKCSNFRLVYFSGLHFHGGSPPRAEHGFDDIPDWCTRFNNILYPNDFLLSGFIAMVLAVSAALGRIELFSAMRYDPKGPVTVGEGPLNFMRDGDSIMSRQAYIQYISRQMVILLEGIMSQSPHLGLNMDAVRSLFIDKLTNQVVDFWGTWQYPPDQMPTKSEDMASHSQYMEHKKVDVCLSVPTQLRRLYNSGKLKMTKDADSTGRGTLKINQQALVKAKKKQKVRHVAEEDGNAFGHGEEVPILRRSTRKRTVKNLTEGSDDEEAEEGVDACLTKSPYGIPSILDKRLKILIFPSFTLQHLEVLSTFTSSSPQPHQRSKLALITMLSEWTNREVRDIKRFVGATKEWRAVQKGSHLAESLDLCACILRAQTMFGHWIWWSYLREEVPSHVKRYLEGEGSDHWVTQVVAYIHKQYDLNLASSVLVSFPSVFPQLSSDFQGVFEDADIGRTGIVLEDQTTDRLIIHTCEVISQWVNLPHSQRDGNRNTNFGDWDTRGFFVDAIMQLNHPGLLLLPDLYKVYNIARLPSLTDQDAHWIDKLLAQAFLSEDEEIISRVEGLDAIASSFLPKEQDGWTLSDTLPSATIIRSCPPSRVPPAISTALLSEEELRALADVPDAIKVAGDAIIAFLCDIERLHGPDGASYVSRFPDEWDRNSVFPELSQIELIRQWVAWNRDHHSPFREDAPSRYTYRLAFGDLSYTTASAIFSEFVFRGVTYHTPYTRGVFAPRADDDTSPRPQIVLRDLNHWKQVVEDISIHLRRKGKSEKDIKKHFCSMTAYGGAPTSQRRLENADKFWLAAVEWEKTFGRSTLPIPYKKYKKFMDEQKDAGNLYSIGDLQLMLIHGDLYYAGAVEASSDEEFFKTMLKAGAGAADGLQLLGVLDNLEVVNAARREQGQPLMRGPDPSRVDAATKLYNYLRSTLHGMDKSHLLPDKFHYEHLLCKVKRVITKAPVQYQVFAPFFGNIPKDPESEDTVQKKNTNKKKGTGSTKKKKST